MGNLVSSTRSLLPAFLRSHWVSDLAAARALVSRFNQAADFGFAVNFDTFCRLFTSNASSSRKSAGIPLFERKEVFDVWCGDRERADALQIFAGTILCCKASFSDKVEALFQLFDMNNDCHLSRDEMQLLVGRNKILQEFLGSRSPLIRFFQVGACVNGLCRMTGCVPLTNEAITDLSRLCFRAADRQRNKGLFLFFWEFKNLVSNFFTAIFHQTIALRAMNCYSGRFLHLRRLLW